MIFSIIIRFEIYLNLFSLNFNRIMGKIFKTIEEIKYVNIKNKNSSCLGSGAFGEVHLVSHIDGSTKKYAMKMIKKYPA